MYKKVLKHSEHLGVDMFARALGSETKIIPDTHLPMKKQLLTVQTVTKKNM